MEAGENRPSWLFLACVVLGVLQFPIVLLFATGEGSLVEPAHAVSASVAASAIWWAVFSRYAEAEGRGFLDRQLELQRDQLNEELEEHRDLLVAEMEDVARRWRTTSFPRDIYPATEGFDLRFNRDLTRDLQRSSKYFFCGPTGIYVPARIRLQEDDSRPLEDVRVKVIDPQSDLAMAQAVADRRSKAKHEDKGDARIRKEITADVYMTVIALWHFRKFVIGTIRIWYESTAVIKRVEVFDRAIYDSRIDVPGPEAFPLTGCWAAGQPAYVQINEEFHRRDPGPASLAITPGMSEERLRRHLAERQIDAAHMARLWEAYQERYVSYLESLLPKALALREIEPIERPPEENSK